MSSDPLAIAPETPSAPIPAADADKPLRLAYIMSRFPKLTETFVLDEILEHERQGHSVEVFPLWREEPDLVHGDALPIVARAHFTPTLDMAILRDNLHCLLSKPGLYVSTLLCLVRANRRSLRYLAGALAVFPKACSFARRMRRLGIDHVHAHFASHPAAAAFVVGRFSGIPWSFTAHGSDLHREQSMLREKVEEAAFVVAISDYNRRFILDRVGQPCAPKLVVIHCGIDPARHGRARRRKAAEEPFEIVCVGTLHEVKGQGFLLEACAALTDRGLRWRCHLIGDGPDRERLETRARELGIGERVIFHGGCERREVGRLLSQMDVCVAPSIPTRDGRREGIPVVLMEAAAAALPLVGSRLSGIPELVIDGETGLLVEPGDVGGLVTALERIARDPRLADRLGTNAHALLESAFDLERNVARLREQIRTGVAA